MKDILIDITLVILFSVLIYGVYQHTSIETIPELIVRIVVSLGGVGFLAYLVKRYK